MKTWFNENRLIIGFALGVLFTTLMYGIPR